MQNNNEKICVTPATYMASSRTKLSDLPSNLVEQYITYEPGEVLFHPYEETVNQLQFIISGRVKRYQANLNGEVLIIDFPGPSDWLSLDTLGTSKRITGAAALTSCKIAVIGILKLKSTLARQPHCAELFTQLVAADLAKMQQHTARLRHMNATRRVTTFLLEYANQSPSLQGINVPLPMSRNDIGNYLGLTPMTVSRTLSKLCRNGSLKIGHRSYTLMPQIDCDDTDLRTQHQSDGLHAQATANRS